MTCENLSITFNLLSSSIEKSPRYEHTPRTVQVRQVGESVKFQVIATIVKPVINWHIHVKVDGKDTVRPITAEHNISLIRRQSSRTSILTLVNLRLQDGGHYVAIGTYDGQEHSILFTVDVYGKYNRFITIQMLGINGIQKVFLL